MHARNGLYGVTNRKNNGKRWRWSERILCSAPSNAAMIHDAVPLQLSKTAGVSTVIIHRQPWKEHRQSRVL